MEKKKVCLPRKARGENKRSRTDAVKRKRKKNKKNWGDDRSELSLEDVA